MADNDNGNNQTTRDPRDQGGSGPPVWSLLLGALGGLLVVGFIAYAVVIGDVEQLEAPWIAGGVAGALLLGAWLYVERDGLQRASSTQGARYTTGAALMVAMALGIAVLLNVVAERYDDRYDMTTAGLFTLSDQTRTVTEGLEADVKVIAFFSSGAPEEIEFRTLIEGYEELSDKLTVEFKDPLRNPLLAEQYEVATQWGTVILEQGERTQRLESSFDEEAVTNALVRLTSGRGPHPVLRLRPRGAGPDGHL